MHNQKLSVDSQVCPSLGGNAASMDAMLKGEYDGKRVAVLSQKYIPLFEVEAYAKEVAQERGIELCYDVTAVEDLFFKTLNYTTYAGMFILHPLCFEQSMRQMFDAYGDNIREPNHIGFIRNNMFENGTISKYSFGDGPKTDAKNALVVLTGGNKLKKHCCAGKMKAILEKHGKENVLFKKHPVSHDEIYDELNEFLGGGINFADGYSDLFQLIKGSEYIYSTMMSESALIAALLHKKLDHFDLLQNRETTSFGHINNFIYTTRDPLSWLNRCFASPKSGVIHPAVDMNWPQKIDQYFDYILELRNFYNGAYQF